MKYSFGLQPVLIIAFLFFLAGPACSSGRDRQTDSDPSADAMIYEKESFGFLKFYSDHILRFHSNVQHLFNLQGIDDSLLKPVVTTGFINPGEAPSTQFEHSAGNVMKQEELNDRPKQTRYAYLLENLKSPILLPYKYKTVNNMLISLILPIAATDQLTIVPVVSYIFFMNGSGRTDLRDKGLSPYKDENIFYGGINLSYSF